MSKPIINPQPKQSTDYRSAPNDNKPVVVGLYGVPGSGKTFLLDQLKEELGTEHFAFYEGSKVIATLVPGDLNGFQKLGELEKEKWRKLAIDTIRKECGESGRVAVVAGHFMFWSEEEEAGRPVYTQNDLDTFTHILYLDVLPEVVVQRLLHDTERVRPSTSITHLCKWQQAEKTQLRHLCRKHKILFSLVSPHPTMLNKVLTLLHDFRHHTEKYNLCQAEGRLKEIIAAGEGRLKTMLVMDADRTLAPQDTGTLFWQRVRSLSKDDTDPLKTLFSSPLLYTYTAFRQAVLLYEETVDDEKFDSLCQDVAASVTMYPEFVSLLQRVAGQEHVGAVVVTCGLRRVWEKVLEREGLSKEVKVIGGGRITDGFVVTAAVKAALVGRLQNANQIYVWAFGDSPLDLEMLSKADQAIVVVGQEQTRSKTMDLDLFNLIHDGGLRACQVVLPSCTSPRLDTKMLPLIQLTSGEFFNSILHCRRQDADIQVLHATHRNAAKLLMTPMRDATNAGPQLREAHRRAGWYLATEFLANVVDIEEYPIPHVQGNQTSGYRLCNEQQTLIVALMRGGEPMALGVSDAFPLAVFIHANHPDDIMLHHLQGQCNVVLVDSVVNSGKTVIQFVQHVRNLHATIRIVVVAGIIQAQSVSGGSLTQALGQVGLSVIALRLSENKFTGRGATDTGNRLFNTTHLP
ncbi:PRTase-like protein [Glarea lozoyensis ATCC 20868]|uniref:PRTase-like protein n=1 Tax=Glarea lozoyensis (strain ATCC 20868 / MF5171) TaxID=1116229 RepID=S3DAY7_GLAL2|nr:PRTase-like protein [Glarea lozoyensis ATCC 20868]EPE34264.1 PRTase-like protein [Glarea lozoyensis ATCC 20868]